MPPFLFAQFFFAFVPFSFYLNCMFFFCTLSSLRYLQALENMRSATREREEKTQFSFHAHRRRLANKKHSLFSFLFEKIVHSNSKLLGFFASYWMFRNVWQFIQSLKPCMDPLRRAHTHTLISNNKIDFLSRFSLSHFIFSQTSSAFAVVQSAIRFLWNFISWKWINRCKRVQVGEWNPHWASRHMQVTGDEKKTLSIELFWVIKGI